MTDRSGNRTGLGHDPAPAAIVGTVPAPVAGARPVAPIGVEDFVVTVVNDVDARLNLDHGRCDLEPHLRYSRLNLDLHEQRENQDHVGFLSGHRTNVAATVPLADRACAYKGAR
jgi:hypothetical protein